MPRRTPRGRSRVAPASALVCGARSGALAQEYYARQGVCANIWVSRSWAYSDELMSACMGIGSTEWQQAAWGLNQTDRPGAVWLKAFTAAMDEKKRPIFCIYNPDLESSHFFVPGLVGIILQMVTVFLTAFAIVGERCEIGGGSKSMPLGTGRRQR